MYIFLIWICGFLLCKWMLKAEHLSEEESFSNGQMAISILLSILSWVMILILLVKAWAGTVKKYWSKPVKSKKTVE